MLKFLIQSLVLLLFDAYVFRVIQNLKRIKIKWLKIALYTLYWLVPTFYICYLLYFRFLRPVNILRTDISRLYFVGSIAVLYAPKLFIALFQAFEDGTKILAWITKKLSPPESKIHKKADHISRSLFISRLGLLISAIPFSSLIYSIGIGRFNFKLNRVAIEFDHLPKAFNGFKIVQFSDLHAGSLVGHESEFKKAMEMINEQNADIIVFTGDLINNFVHELDGWLDILTSLKAKNGKFSILGNHDYGIYHRREKNDMIASNFEKLKQYHAKTGFNLLMNHSEILEKEGQQIAIIGVENWGERNFKFGKLDVAMENIHEIPFKLLLSHDPSHWDNQVLGKTDIALTLSGHTHGLQMALNFGGYTWNPISYRFKRRNGLYTENNQHLYVNTGLGYIDFPGRIGADPEITVFELRTKSFT